MENKLYIIVNRENMCGCWHMVNANADCGEKDKKKKEGKLNWKLFCVVFHMAFANSLNSWNVEFSQTFINVSVILYSSLTLFWL